VNLNSNRQNNSYQNILSKLNHLFLTSPNPNNFFFFLILNFVKSSAKVQYTKLNVKLVSIQGFLEQGNSVASMLFIKTRNLTSFHVVTRNVLMNKKITSPIDEVINRGQFIKSSRQGFQTKKNPKSRKKCQ